MRQYISASVGLCVVVAGCFSSPRDKSAAKTSPQAKQRQPAQTAGKSGAGDSFKSGGFVISQPIRHENLTIFPVVSEIAKNDDRFITLDEGLKAKTVEVTEVGARRLLQSAATMPDDAPAASEDAGLDDEFGNDNLRQRSRVELPTAEMPDDDPFDIGVGGDVNHLLVLNSSDKPLYLMPGEIIVGGLQDRSIAAETIVQPGPKPVSVEVYCVEHGRWHGRGSADFAMLASTLLEDFDDAVIEKLGQEAAAGKFVASAGNLSKRARFSAQAAEGQSRVWEEVGSANARNGISGESGAFTGNYAQADVRKKLDPFLEGLQEPVANTDRVVGVVVAINGKVEMAEIFESTPLFRKLWPKLLKGYALDAVTVTDEKDASKICTGKEAKAFLDKAREADVEKTEEKGGLIVTARSSKDVKSFSAGMGDVGGGFGEAVHAAAY